jgi:hypothetical protein
MKQKGFALISIALVVLVFAGIGWFGYWLFTKGLSEQEYCSDVTTYAKNSNGECKEFSNSCLPDGWVYVESCDGIPGIIGAPKQETQIVSEPQTAIITEPTPTPIPTPTPTPAPTLISVDGRCGSALDSTYASSPTSDLCSVGTASAVVLSGEIWRWSCEGSNLRKSAFCYANVAGAKNAAPPSGPAEVMADGQCGSSSNGTYASSPASGLCSAGTANDVVLNEGTWEWSCNGSGGGTDVFCYANFGVASAAIPTPTPTPIPTPTPVPLPDLVVIDQSIFYKPISPVNSNDIRFWFTIQNVGTAPAGNFDSAPGNDYYRYEGLSVAYVWIDLDSNGGPDPKTWDFYLKTNISPLNANSVVTGTALWGASYAYPTVGGTHRFIVCADAEQQVAEANENNNCSSIKTITVSR